MKAPKIDLGGIKILATTEIAWEIRGGTQPVIRDFPIHAGAEAFAFLRRGHPQTLTIEAMGIKRTIKNLWILSIEAGPIPDIKILRVADRRWMWSYGHVVRRYNVRRKVGSFRPKSPNEKILTPVVDRIKYWDWSLNEGERWEGPDLLEDFLKQGLFRGEQSLLGGDRPPFAYALRISDNIKPLPIENLEIDDPCDVAFKRILDHFPGVDCFIDTEGRVVLYDRADGTEGLLLSGFKIDKQQALGWVDKAAVRPSSIRVYFTIECEMRFDYVEATKRTGSYVNPTHVHLEASRLLENVLPFPDFTGVVVDSEHPLGKTVHQGTWVRLKDAMSSWGSAEGDNRFPPIGGPPVRLTDLRKAALPFVDLAGGTIPPNTRNPDLHLARVAALQEHYRRTFRIPQPWMDRFLSIRPYRVGTIDPATGTRAPAVVYCDYAMMRSSPVVFDNIGLPEAERALYAMNVKGYPRAENGGFEMDSLWGIRSINPKSLTAGKVSVVDQEQGILQLDFVTGPMRYFDHIIPGQIEDGSEPKADIRLQGIGAEGRPIAFNAKPSGGKLPELEPSWRAAVILTAVPSSPNDNRQLFSIDVSHDDPGLRELLPRGVQHNRGLGPQKEVRVDPGFETCRIHWQDNAADLIMNEVFGYDSPTAGESAEEVDLEDLIINMQNRAGAPGATTILPGNHLENIALAEAAKIYAEYSDAHEGQGGFAFDDGPGVIRGNIESITFKIAPDGEATISVSCPGDLPELSLFSFLDDGTRAFLMRLAQGPKLVN